MKCKGALAALVMTLLLASVPAALADGGPQTVSEQAYSGTLDYALAKTEREGFVLLDLGQIAQVYGVDAVRLQQARPGEGYAPVSQEEGMAVLEANGQTLSVTVENAAGMVLWAGVYEGGTAAPRSLVNWAVEQASPEQPVEQSPEQPVEQSPEQPAEQPPEQPVEQSPEQPAEQPPEQPVEQPPEQPAEQPPEQPAEPALVLDLSALAESFAGPLQILATSDAGTYIPAEGSGEDGLWYVSGGAMDRYAQIMSGPEGAQQMIWAGLIPGDIGAGKVVFHAVSPASAPLPPEQQDISLPAGDGVTSGSFTVLAADYEGAYDGTPHAAAVSSSEEGVTYYYALCGKQDEVPGETWELGLPELTDAGELWAFIRAEKEGCTAIYQAEGEEPLPWGQEWIKTHILIEPARVELQLWAEQTEQAVYTGMEQTITMRFDAEISKGDGELFPLQAMKEAEGWVSQVTVTATDAGTYAVKPTPEQVSFLCSFDPNFKVTVRPKASAAVIAPKPVRFESAAAAALYEPAGGSLTAAGAVQGVLDLETGDYYSGDIVASGEQQGAGVGYNTIVLGGRFEERQENYEFDLDAGAGPLVVFPQSISEDDVSWDTAKDTIDPWEYAQTASDSLPGYYAGIRVELESEASQYDGSEADISVRILDKNGTVLDLQEGVDYRVSYTRDGEKTKDLTTPGEIGVQITGKGNYAGTVERSYTIGMPDVDASVQLESWTYDGTAAGSSGHSVSALGPDVEPVYTYYDESGQEVEPPSDAGSYRLTASWPETAISPAVAAECSFSISPAEAVVYAQDGGKTYGDEDPVLGIGRIEGLVGDDDILCSVTRRSGEDVGSYDIVPTLSGEERNYLVRCVSGTFRITPRSLEDESIEVRWQEQSPELYRDGAALTPDVDYTAQAVSSDRADKEQMILVGEGNYTGRRAIERDLDVEVELSLTDGSGQDLREDGLTLGRNGTLQMGGTVRTSVPVDPERLSASIEGRQVQVQWTGTDEGVYSFTIQNEPIEDEAEKIRVSVLLDGEDAAEQDVTVLRRNGAILWGCAAAGLALCSLGSLLACLRFTKRLRREKEKLLDTVSRQSSRTIRQNGE